jgi:hypothetical protein
MLGFIKKQVPKSCFHKQNNQHLVLVAQDQVMAQVIHQVMVQTQDPEVQVDDHLLVRVVDVSHQAEVLEQRIADQKARIFLIHDLLTKRQ